MEIGEYPLYIPCSSLKPYEMGIRSFRTLGSSIVGAGLSWWQATIVVWIAAGVSGMCMALNSRAAASYHVGYPVILRTCFGMYGHYWPVVTRGACAMLWVSVLSKIPFFQRLCLLKFKLTFSIERLPRWCIRFDDASLHLWASMGQPWRAATSVHRHHTPTLPRLPDILGH